MSHLDRLIASACLLHMSRVIAKRVSYIAECVHGLSASSCNDASQARWFDKRTARRTTIARAKNTIQETTDIIKYSLKATFREAHEKRCVGRVKVVVWCFYGNR
jgi:ribose 5-phosphate isomerase RpiB